MMKSQIVLGALITMFLLLVACGEQQSSPATGPESTTVTAGPGQTTADTATATPVSASIPPTTASLPPTASFTVDEESGSAPVTVKFNNASQGPITSVEWDFGDGSTSTDRTPTHRYTVAGTHDVTLTVSGPGGTDTSVRSGLITIEPGPPTGIEITPATATIAVQGTTKFTAVAQDEFGNPVPGTFDWGVAGDGGSISEDGLFTADTLAGTFADAIVASLRSGEAAGSASVTVAPGPLSRIVVDPAEVTLEIGGTQAFSFKAFDEFDNETTSLIASWTVSAEVGTIDAGGTLTTGTKAGPFIGALRLEAVEGTDRASATADVVVLPGPLAAVQVKPADVIVKGGTSMEFVAAGLDQYGNELPQLAYIWEALGGNITNAGLFTATGSGGSYEVVAKATSKGVVASGSASVEVPPNFSNFIDLASFNLLADAEKCCGDVLRFPAKPGPWPETSMGGAAWFTSKQLVRDGFETTFEFRITGIEEGGGAGFAFVVQNHDISVFGFNSGSDGIGYHGLRNSIAIEFDTFWNEWTLDPDDNHISVHTQGRRPNWAQETYSIGIVSPSIDMSSGAIHTVKIEYVPGTMSIFLNDLSIPLLEISLDIAGSLTLDDGKAWVGFTGSSNGPWTQNHDILSWSFNSVIVE